MNFYKKLIVLYLLFSMVPFGIAQQKDSFVVVLDAGHGGRDPGSLGNGFIEKNIALKVVKQIGATLSKDSQIKVIYTRTKDVFVDLFDRGKIANEAKADLFVSIHCDSHSSNVHGAGTFVLGLHANENNFKVAKSENESIYFEDDYHTKYAKYDINSKESIIGLTLMQEEFLSQSMFLAKKVQDNFVHKLKRADRKVKQAGFIVLHQTFMPSVLIELGFLSNRKEGTYLNSSKGQEEMGKSIAEAIKSYKNAFVEGKDKAKKPKKKSTLTKKETSTVVKKDKKTIEKQDLIFKVQLVASSKKIPLKAANFKNLSPLSKEKYKKLYRYFYGATTSYVQAKTFRKAAIAKGYEKSYIVAYKKGKRIPLSKALKMSNAKGL